jgi:ElaB/YqjD/DUF883 family membrane-anchored ribosome-binding protein
MHARLQRSEMERTNMSDKYADNGSGLTKERLEETIEAAREKLDEYSRSIATFVRERPATALMLALGAGYLVGRFLRR